MVDGVDVAGVADVHEWVGGEDDEIGGVAGFDEADVELGVEGLEEASVLAGGDGDGLEWGEACGDEVFELTVFAEAGNAAGDGSGVGAEGYGDAGVVDGLEVLEGDGVVFLGLGGLGGAQGFAGVVGGLEFG